jgi:hypothetical protein
VSEDQDYPYQDEGAIDEDEEDADGEEELSPSSQIGREQVGGSHVSVQEPSAQAREGWPMPDQSYTPPEWPEATID